MSISVNATAKMEVELGDHEISKVVKSGAASINDYIIGIRTATMKHRDVYVYNAGGDMQYDLRDRIWYSYDWRGDKQILKSLTDIEFDILTALEEFTSVVILAELR